MNTPPPPQDPEHGDIVVDSQFISRVGKRYPIPCSSSVHSASCSSLTGIHNPSPEQEQGLPKSVPSTKISDESSEASRLN